MSDQALRCWENVIRFVSHRVLAVCLASRKFCIIIIEFAAGSLCYLKIANLSKLLLTVLIGKMMH
jgi:hypothetical protein